MPDPTPPDPLATPPDASAAVADRPPADRALVLSPQPSTAGAPAGGPPADGHAAPAPTAPRSRAPVATVPVATVPLAAVPDATGARPGTSGSPRPPARATPGRTVRLAVALLSAALALALTVVVAPYMPHALFVVSFAAVTIAAGYGGMWAGVLAAVVCVLGIDYLLIPPVRALQPTDPADLIPMGAFMVVAALVGRVADALRTAREAEARAGASLVAVNRELAARSAALERGHHTLHEQAAELEAANLQLQDTQVELEAQADALAAANATLAESARALEAQRTAADRARRRVEAVLESTTDAFVALDREWRVVQMNGVAAQLHGSPRETVLGRTHWEVWPATVGSVIEREYERVMRERVPTRFEHHYVEPPTYDTWFETAAYPWEDGIAVFYRDVTDRKRAELALHDREARWHTLAEAMPQLVWTCRADGYSDFSNQRWLDYTGQRQEETWGLGWMDVMHPDDRQPTLDAWEPAVARGEPFESYYRLRRAADGEYRWFLARAMPQRDAEGRITRWFGSCTDVHDARTAAEERERLLAAEQAARGAAEAAATRERTLARASELLAASLDVEATLRQVAALAVPALADWCAVDLVDGAGRFRRLAVCHPDPEKVRLAYELEARYPDDPAAAHGRYNVLRTGEPEWMTDIPDALLVAACRDAEHLRIVRALALRSYIAVPLAGRERVLGVLTLVVAESERRYTEADVTLAVELGRRAAVAIENARLIAALRESEEHLQEQAAELELQTEELEATTEELMQQTEAAEQARRVAEEANQAKTQFLATMSHELRTPLNAIGGYADLLALELRGPITPGQRDDLERIKRSGHHLLGLINDILNFAKLEAGQVEFHLRDVPVATLLDDVQPLVAPQMRARGLTFVAAEPPAGLRVRADVEKVRQVLLNLLTNAVKFTEPGGEVRIACAPTRDADGTPRVCCTVTDTGRGIPADQLERIFEPFVQVDRHRTQASQQGIGLGLAISRDLARGMGGELRVTSTPGAGSVFTLELPQP
jgi:PAS domain S-box-containing protein